MRESIRLEQPGAVQPERGLAADRGRMMAVHCPADGRWVGAVPHHSAEDVRRVAERLRAAQPAWEDLGVDGRCKVLRELLDWILDNECRLVEIMQSETGSRGATRP